MPVITVRACLHVAALVVLTMASGCGLFGKKSVLPADPGLLTEDFGKGITLAMPLATAKPLEEFAGNVIVEVISPEDLANRNPYEELETGKEMLLAISAADEIGNEFIREIRCYPQEVPAELTLKGEKAALLRAVDIERIFGQPNQRTAASDATTHLVYLFQHPTERRKRLRFTTSHDFKDRCFAIELVLEDTDRSPD
jgi:hypothetical protein